MTPAVPFHPRETARCLGAGNVLAALVLATATGSGLTALLFVGGAALPPSIDRIVMAIPDLPLFFFSACPVWLAGLMAIGGPCWWMLHRLGARSPWTAPLAGALLTLLTAGGYLALSPTERSSIEAWMFVAGLTAIGAVTGRVLVKIAYAKGAAR
ncbi:hypothetical protein [Caulobacter sp. LARHSG274]